jgi:septal ring factor EnvC (AmiA/AmiB activator)
LAQARASDAVAASWWQWYAKETAGTSCSHGHAHDGASSTLDVLVQAGMANQISSLEGDVKGLSAERDSLQTKLEDTEQELANERETGSALGETVIGLKRDARQVQSRAEKAEQRAASLDDGVRTRWHITRACCARLVCTFWKPAPLQFKLHTL